MTVRTGENPKIVEAKTKQSMKVEVDTTGRNYDLEEFR